MNSLIFLGTGGGSKVVFTQVRASGGIYFELDGKRFILDPGPGSLVHMRNLKLKEPHGLLVSHYHIDHISDANILLDVVEKPFLIAEEHCIKGADTRISKYHLSRVDFLKPMKTGNSVKIPGSEINVKATEAKHTAPCIGFLISGSRKIGYVSDSIYFKGMEKPFESCDLLILNILVPSGKIPAENKHLGIDGAVKMINAMKKKPKLAIIQHLSFWMIKNNANAQARILEKATNVPVIAAKDFMKINLDDLKAEKKGLEKFT
jgi:ribonuclease BN (tRNA processing enzyme)